MDAGLAIGRAVKFTQGFQDFLCNTCYAVVAIHPDSYTVVPVDARDHTVSRNVRMIRRAPLIDLYQAGALELTPLPIIDTPSRATTRHSGMGYFEPSAEGMARKALLAPIYERRHEILSAARPWEVFNKIAKAAGLNQTRARALFFRWAAYSFDDLALEPTFTNLKKNINGEPAASRRKPGPKVLNPGITPVGWPFDGAWEPKILSGWKKFAIAPTTLRRVHTRTLVHKFDCVVDTTGPMPQIFAPDGGSFPNERQFARFIKAKLGETAYYEGLRGVHTVRNHPKSNPESMQQHVTNLLQEVQWDAQFLDERPGDLLDSSKPGKAIVRVVATDVACGGVVGIGYDYGSESHWAYLMALLSMCMPKSEFGELFGVEIFDADWPPIGVMMKVRGDRGPAIAQRVQDLVSDVLGICQEWCASYDPRGKAFAEAAHYKQPQPEGPPRRQLVYRTPIEIVRDDLRKTVSRFRSADMTHRIESLAQGQRINVGTPLTIWEDLRERGLYVGQLFAVDKLIPLTMPRHEVTISDAGVHLGALRYLSPALKESGLLERARSGKLTGHAYALNMVTKDIWLEYQGGLLRLTAVPVRLNAMSAVHSMTLEESFAFETLLRQSRRESEQLRQALALRDEIDASIDRNAVAHFQEDLATGQSSDQGETIRQHRHVLTRKRQHR